MDDLISRQAAIDNICKSWCKTPHNQCQYKVLFDDEEMYCDGCEDVEILQNMPSAQPFDKDINVPDNDTISRQGVLRLLNAVPSEEFATKAMLISGVKALPSAQPEWIPWDSGGFPEESGTYTVTAYDGVTKRVTYAKYQKRLKRWELTGARAYWRVLAWMEKPKPWEGGQDEN